MCVLFCSDKCTSIVVDVSRCFAGARLEMRCCTEAPSSRQVVTCLSRLSLLTCVLGGVCCALLRVLFVFATGVRPYRRLRPQHSSQHGSYHGEVVSSEVSACRQQRKMHLPPTVLPLCAGMSRTNCHSVLLTSASLLV